MADPFDTLSPGDPSSAVGPDFWHNLTSFGLATLAAASQRGYMGVPAYNGLGALGAGGLAAMDQARQNAIMRQQMGFQNAQIGNIQSETRSRNFQNSMMLRQANMQGSLYGMPPLSMDAQGNVLPADQSGAPSTAQPPGNDKPDPSLSAGMPNSPSAGVTHMATPAGAPMTTSSTAPVGNGGAAPSIPGGTSAPNGPLGIPRDVLIGATAPTPQQAAMLANLHGMAGDQQGAEFYRKLAINPAQGFTVNPNFTQSPIPGGVADPRYIGAKSSAEAWGQAPAQLWVKQNSPAELRGPGSVWFDPSSGRSVQVPNEIGTVDPNTGAGYKEFVPLGLNFQNGPAAPGGAPAPSPQPPVNAPGMTLGAAPSPLTGQPFNQGASGQPQPNAGVPTAATNAQGYPRLQTSLAPMQKEQLEARGKELGEYRSTLDAQASSAVQSNFLLDQMRNESQSWQMGKFADVEGEARGYLQSFARGFNIDTPQLDQKLADYQSFVKNAGQLTRAATREVSSRAAFQEMQFIQGTLPNPEMSKGGFDQVVNQLQAVNDYTIAKQQAAAQWGQAHGTLDGFDVDFNQKVTPGIFLVNRMGPDQQAQLYSGLAKTDQGKKVLMNLRREYAYGLQQGYVGAGANGGG